MSKFRVSLVVLGVAAGVLAHTQMSSCRYQFDNGSEINLMKVAASPLDAPRFKDYPARNKTDKSLYSYNPCYSYVYPPDGQRMSCSKNVAVCQSSAQGYINIGTQQSATFKFSNATQKWIVSYYNANGDTQTNLILQCTNDTKDSLDVWGETRGMHRSVYKITLISRCACVDGCGTPILPHGMSVGSFLLLLLLLFVATYLFVGLMYRRYVIGARGLELMPHLSFWMDFPFLVQDGFFFLVKCGHGDVTYERI
ncbi:cation-dependent mannose-6-phosphate receptor-like isoform X1 [Panulirus ornatus]|uniref:cation-dependent mannose-6-phosphate receptor-like isoform X1 n=1 Tax=Panulirus ornatus TaxID=150431 RepID=UPI003A8BFAA7